MNKRFYIPLFIGLSVISYYTCRLYIFAKQSSKAFEYVYAGLDCLIQEGGQNENDMDILFKGFKSRKAYVEAANKEFPGLYTKEESDRIIIRKVYNDQIPECHNFFARYRCWELDEKDSLSLDNCGKYFGLNQKEIEILKKSPTDAERDTIWNGVWKRKEKK